jgi:tripartite-type tricarboxylate transporter receptor subunit TctC
MKKNLAEPSMNHPVSRRRSSVGDTHPTIPRRSALKTLVTAAAVAALPSALMSPAWGQASDYPNKSIRLIVPFPAGGTSDTLARIIAQKLTDAWGQSVIVDNRAGANGNLGADAVAKAAPDGYTLVLMDCGNLTISPSLYPKLPFNPLTDFAPVTMFAYSPHLLVVSNKLPVKTFPELISYVKANPGKVNFAAAAGTGSAPHLAGVLLAQRAGLEWAYVPYKGGAQALNDMAGGQVDVTMNLSVRQEQQRQAAGRFECQAPAAGTRDPDRRRDLSGLPDGVVARRPGAGQDAKGDRRQAQ